jgi:hypothetical protein
MRVNIRLKNEQRVKADFGKRLTNDVKNAMQVKAESLAKKLVQHVRSNQLRGQMYKRRTGELARSVAAKIKATQGYVQIKLEATAPYARILNDGGRIPPHVIRAQGKAMKFRAVLRGKALFATTVNHPGAKFKGKPFLAASLKAMTPEINSELKAALIKSIGRK